MSAPPLDLHAMRRLQCLEVGDIVLVKEMAPRTVVSPGDTYQKSFPKEFFRNSKVIASAAPAAIRRGC